MILTPDQIRAARALKDWSQADLAEASGLAVPTIANIEAAKQEPGQQTLAKIEAAFQKAEIEFTAGEGVRKKRESVKIFRGMQEYREFFFQCYNHLAENGGSLYANRGDAQNYQQWWQEFPFQTFLDRLRKSTHEIDYRTICREDNTYFPAAGVCEYRWMPVESIPTVTFYVFDDYFAITFFSDEPIIISIQSKECADLYREKFLLQWERAKEFSS